ncbi:MAG: haloacid dehalogenase type II [Gammaproteobacteria bacterium]|nr:haloacid dehalogenase type II [Gammaproteobacteria bacterium]
MDRRNFLSLAAGGTALGLTMNPFMNLAMAATAKPEIKAIVFDAFPIFDPRPIFGLVNSLFPEQGGALGKLWFTKIFGYTWLRTVGEHYKDFYAVIEDALIFSAQSLQLDLTPDKQKQLMQVWLKLKVWPDVKPTLQQLQEQNIRLGFLSNMTEEMLRTNAKNSGIEDAFEFYLSTDRAQAFKPDPRAYRMGVDAFGLPKENIAFAAFAGWDASGASWFGYPTVWVNRLDQKAENLGAGALVAGKDMRSLVNFVAR